MKKWIRWPGVIVFVVAVIVVAGLWWSLVDAAVKRIIEMTGTRIVGAKVELDRADLSLLPMGLTLQRLQITDPDQPMENAVEVDRIAGTLDLGNLLRRKIIVEEMAMEGVRLRQPRTTSGALRKTPPPAPEKEASGEGRFRLPSMEIPDPSAILAKEELTSLALTEEVRGEIDAAKVRWKQQLSELPDKETLQTYKTRLDEVRDKAKGGLGGILGGAGELVAIQKELRTDLDRIRSAREGIKADLATLRKRIDEAAAAPQVDLRRLMDRYSLSAEGLAHLTQALFGEQITGRLQALLRWYERLTPLLSRTAERKKGAEVVKRIRGKGVDVRFKEAVPLPDFLIRTLHASVVIPQGDISGRVRNITPDQDRLGSPLTFAFAGEKLKGLNTVHLDGTMNRTDPSRPNDQATFRLTGYRIKELALSKSEAWPVMLQEGLADLDLEGRLAGEALQAHLTADLKSARMTTGLKPQAGALAEAIAATLADVRGMELKAEITGTPTDPRIRLTSDLDRILKEAVGKQLQAQTARLEGQLKKAIAEKVSGSLDGLRADLGGLGGLEEELGNRLQLGDTLLKEKVPGIKLPF